MRLSSETKELMYICPKDFISKYIMLIHSNLFFSFYSCERCSLIDHMIFIFFKILSLPYLNGNLAHPLENAKKKTLRNDILFYVNWNGLWGLEEVKNEKKWLQKDKTDGRKHGKTRQPFLLHAGTQQMFPACFSCVLTVICFYWIR